MESKCETTNAYTRKLSVQTAATEVDAAWSKALRKVGRSANLPGFRPGKAPRAMLERAYAPSLQDAAQTALIDATLSTACVAHAIEPIARPNVQIGDLEPGKACDYVAFLEVRPEIELQKLEGLEVALPAAVEVEPLVEARLTALRNEGAQIEPVTGRTQVTETDLVVINYLGKVDGKAFAGGSAKEVLFDVENSGYIEGFAAGLIGAEVPSTRTLALRFPEDYGSKALAGQSASFEVELLELKARHLPALDDEWAKDVGAADLAALRTKVHGEIEAEQAKVAQKAREDAVLKALASANPVEVPPSMVENQVDRMLQQKIEQYERATGQKLNLRPEQQDGLRRGSLQEAEDAVRSGLLLLAASAKLGLQVDEAEINAEIEKRVLRWPDQIDEARRALSTPEYREDLKFSLLEEKTLAHLLAHAKT